jgi:hypothetical protein
MMKYLAFIMAGIILFVAGISLAPQLSPGQAEAKVSIDPVSANHHPERVVATGDFREASHEETAEEVFAELVDLVKKGDTYGAERLMTPSAVAYEARYGSIWTKDYVSLTRFYLYTLERSMGEVEESDINGSTASLYRTITWLADDEIFKGETIVTKYQFVFYKTEGGWKLNSIDRLPV